MKIIDDLKHLDPKDFNKFIQILVDLLNWFI